MNKTRVKWAAACAIALAMTGAGPVNMTAPARAAGACDSIRAEFNKKVRPRVLRLAKKNFHWSNWYHATLKREQGSAKHPSSAAMSTTHKMMLDYCGSDAKCKAFASEMNSASQAIFNVNKRWTSAGCPGHLDS